MTGFQEWRTPVRLGALAFKTALAATVSGVLAAPSMAAARPASLAAIAAAQPFAASGNSLDHSRAVRCLAYAIYYEAGNQPTEGQRAVAQVVLNRVRSPAFPHTVCGVVFQGAHSKSCQFTFACDGSMARRPAAAAWGRAEEVAEEALSGTVMAQVGVATYYHADYVFPNWSALAKTTQVGAHIFYTRPDDHGPAALDARYAGGEPLIDVHTLVPTAAPPPPPDLVDLLDVQPLAPEEPHATDDVGGRVLVGRGWTPTAPAPQSDAMARIIAAQSAQPVAQAAAQPAQAASTQVAQQGTQ